MRVQLTRMRIGRTRDCLTSPVQTSNPPACRAHHLNRDAQPACAAGSPPWLGHLTRLHATLTTLVETSNSLACRTHRLDRDIQLTCIFPNNAANGRPGGLIFEKTHRVALRGPGFSGRRLERRATGGVLLDNGRRRGRQARIRRTTRRAVRIHRGIFRLAGRDDLARRFRPVLQRVLRKLDEAEGKEQADDGAEQTSALLALSTSCARIFSEPLCQP